MNVGDKVRLMDDDQEGIVRRFLEGNQVEVEIEEGFCIPVMRTNLVQIDKMEDEYFLNKKSEGGVSVNLNFATARTAERTSKVTSAVSEEGIYLAFTEFNDRVLNVSLINNTDLDLLFNFTEEEENRIRGIHSGQLRRKKFVRVYQRNLSEFDEWPPILLQILRCKDGLGKYYEPLIRKMTFKAKPFFKTKKSAPLLRKDAYLFQVDGTEEPPETKHTQSGKIFAEKTTEKPAEKKERLNAQELREQLMGGNTSGSGNGQNSAFAPKTKRPPAEVDLHIDSIMNNYDKLTKSEIISIQLDKFEKAVDDALVSDMKKIIFIHGVGNGKLRDEIHRRLSKHPSIKYYKDARKEKFGYGATEVVFE